LVVLAVSVCIRRADRKDYAELRKIELLSFETLRAVGAVTGKPSASTDDELQHYLDAELLYAAFDERSVPVGYGGAHVAGGWLHIAEMDVHPDWQRRGIGRRLMETLLRDGRNRKLEGATLTTDRFARFNAPFYASLGFSIVDESACPPRLKSILESEKRGGFDPHRRVAMTLTFRALD
jgi:GNAT superfamily N-acetyltransferase